MLLYVQHLLGIGHLRRFDLIARALSARGFNVLTVAGGPPSAGVDFGRGQSVQLPPLRAVDIGFTGLVDQHGRPVDREWLDRRRDRLLGVCRQFDPDAVLIESFPFGRRQMRFELIPLLEMLVSGTSRPLIVSSVRDILQRRKVRRLRETVDLVERYFDAVLVHGDPELVPLQASFPLLPQLSKPAHYTGYVSVRRPQVGGRGRGEVLVAAGGGSVGLALMKTALSARASTRLRRRTWRFLVASRGDLETLRRHREAGAEGVVLELNRSDYGLLLRNSALSISQAGYNTVLDLLQARCRALLVPFEGHGETEQLARARILAGRGLAVVERETALRPERLARAVNRAGGRRAAVLPGLNVDGAEVTARLLAGWLGRVRGSGDGLVESP